MRPFPCMPIPIIPKRTRSLGATACGIAHAGVGSRRIVLAAMPAPAALAVMARKTAVHCRTSNRTKSKKESLSQMRLGGVREFRGKSNRIESVHQGRIAGDDTGNRKAFEFGINRAGVLVRRARPFRIRAELHERRAGVDHLEQGHAFAIYAWNQTL